MMPSSAMFSLCCFSFLIILKASLATNTGCSAEPLLPGIPFVVVWNKPTIACQWKGVHFNFEKWSIVDNNGDRFIGDKVALFYNLGKFPYYNKGKAFNGGIPQLADFDAHYDQIETDLDREIKDRSFAGLGVIDFEYWRPRYSNNFNSDKLIYQEQSRVLAREQHPDLTDVIHSTTARIQFEDSARKVMEGTLDKVIKERPAGRWGYYGFPRWWVNKQRTIDSNDKISWMFNKSTGLYPSIYLTNSPHGTKLWVQNTLEETFRVKAKYSSHHTVVMPYALSQASGRMYTESQLDLSIALPGNMGASGVILWGGSSDARDKDSCLRLKDYVENTLGPYVKRKTSFFAACSRQLCNHQGRCVQKEYERMHQVHPGASRRNECLIHKNHLMTKNTKDTETGQIADDSVITINCTSSVKNEDYNFIDDYVCNCYPGFYGTRCEHIYK